MNQQLASIDQIKNTVLDLAIRFGPKVLVATLILVAGVVASVLWPGKRGPSSIEN